MSFTELKAKALHLQSAQRVKLVNALLQTLDEPEKPLTRTELDRRSDDLRSGRVQGIPAVEMLTEARRRIRS